MFENDKLFNDIINSNSISNSILILGKQGCGKHTFVKELSEHYSYQLCDITDNINLDTVLDAMSSAIDTIYLIDLNKLDIKQQNVILKFLEEPTSTSHIILISNSKTGILDTIYNRCLVYLFKEYTKDELSTFISDDIKEYRDFILSVCDTPGQIKSLYINKDTIPKLQELCSSIVQKLSVAKFANAINISNKLNYTDEYNKIDCTLFVKTLLNYYYNSYLEDFDENKFKAYNIINNYYNIMIDSRINKQRIIESMFSKLKLNIN